MAIRAPGEGKNWAFQALTLFRVLGFQRSLPLPMPKHCNAGCQTNSDTGFGFRTLRYWK